MKNTQTFNFITVALILAAGMALSGYLLSLTIYHSQVANDTVSVKGLAEKEVEADWAQVPVYFTRQILLSKQAFEEMGYTTIVTQLYSAIKSDRAIVEEGLQSLGFAASEISDIESYISSKEFRGEDGQHTDTKVSVQGKLTIESTKVFAIKKVDEAMTNLMSKGLTVSTGQQKYHFSQLNDIKPEMIREAMAAARVAAKELAGNTGVKLGRIKSANQGRFTVVDKGEDYSDTDRIEKKVRVVTQIKFYLGG